MKFLALYLIMSSALLIANVDFTDHTTYTVDSYGAPKQIKQETLKAPHDIQRPRVNVK